VSTRTATAISDRVFYNDGNQRVFSSEEGNRLVFSSKDDDSSYGSAASSTGRFWDRVFYNDGNRWVFSSEEGNRLGRDSPIVKHYS
jgi:hypothetical protein